jgi:hypothetical protein
MALTFSHTTEKLLQKYITALVIWWTAMWKHFMSEYQTP